MTIQQIKSAVDNGQVVHYASQYYTVIKNELDQYLISCSIERRCDSLINNAGQLNGYPWKFYIGDNHPNAEECQFDAAETQFEIDADSPNF